MDCVRRDMQALRITPEDAQDRTFWKSRFRAADLVGKGEEEKDGHKYLVQFATHQFYLKSSLCLKSLCGSLHMDENSL